MAFTVPTGMVNFNNNLGTTPVAIAGVTTATGTQTNRVSRNGVPSACGSTKAFPGAIAAGPRTFDSYTFTACRVMCLSSSVTSPNALNIFEVAYSPSFVPGNIATNYIGDAGFSANGQTCSITTAASTPYTIVVHDTSGTSVGSNYNLQFPACAFNCTPNQVPVAVVHNVTVFVTASGTANASIDNGSSDPDGDPLTITQTPPGPYPLGTTNVLLTVVDPKGATAQASANVTVQLNSTAATVSSSGTPSAFATSVTFTANVASTGNPVTPTGTVIFKDGSTTLGAGTLSGGVATFTTNALAIGGHSITAVYGGNPICAASTSPPFTQTVTGTTALPADISVTVTHSPNNPVIPFGGKLAITITVTNNDATNPATVALNLSTIAGPLELDSVVPPGGATCNPPSAGTIQCSIPALAASTNAVFTVNVRPLFSGVRTFTAIAAEASNTTDATTADNTASDTIKVRFKPFRK